MNETLTWALSMLAGSGLGVLFFGGLWWTVRKVMSSSHSMVWLLGSFVVRMAVTVAGFYFVADGQWQRLLAALLGFVIARIVVTRVTQTIDKSADKAEVIHAP